MDQPALIDPTLRAEPDPSSDAPAGEPLPDLAARWIHHFAVLRKLGEGGMGAVYAAYDERLERRVAIKLLHGAEHARLLREAQALARLSHPHVVQIYEVGEFEGRVFVAMEYVDGPTLSEWLAAAPRGVDEIIEVFVQAGRGLAAAHERGLVHRDFKPGNVIIGADGRVRVLDFGLARAGAAIEGPGAKEKDAEFSLSTNILLSPLTRTGACVGTPAYMSPEQHTGRTVDARSDQFGFCVALFEALHAQRPFAGENLAELAANVIGGKLRPPPPRADLPPAVSAAVLRGLAADPAARWPTMDALLEALDGSSGQGGVLEERIARVLIALVVLGLGLAIFVIAFVGYDHPSDADPAQGVLFALAQALCGCALLPLAYRRLRRPRQRVMIHFALVMFSACLVTRTLCWRAGFTVDMTSLVETLVYASAYATAGVTLRQPWILLTLPLLLTAAALWIELDCSLVVLPLSWLASLSIAVYGLRNVLAGRPGAPGGDPSSSSRHGPTAGRAPPTRSPRP